MLLGAATLTALRGRLPDAILERRKTGFGAPVRLWVAGPMRPMIEDIFASAAFRQRGLFDLGGVGRLLDDIVSGRRDGAYLVLAIVMVELWLRRFQDLPANLQGAPQHADERQCI